jgi:hypothetical protein|nr:MAG TPA: Protein of unknown function (DUF2514) [Caudoviricetes sp.]
MLNWKNYVIGILAASNLCYAMLYRQASHELEKTKQEYAVQVANNKAANAQYIQDILDTQYKGVLNALQDHERERQKIEVDYSDALDANRRLQRTISSLDHQVSRISERTQREYSKALGRVLKECSTEYLSMAKRADQHSAEAEKYRRAIENARARKPKE